MCDTARGQREIVLIESKRRTPLQIILHLLLANPLLIDPDRQHLFLANDDLQLCHEFVLKMIEQFRFQNA